MNFSSSQRLLAEFLGVAAIVAVVLGAAHMATYLSATPAIWLLINALATASVLYVLIVVLGPISGAHLNPIVTFAMLLTRRIDLGLASGYLVAQFLGGFAGALLANLMFSEPAISLSSVERGGDGVLLGESVASLGLVLVILLLIRFEKANLIALAVPAWIFAGYFFTSSTSFANPAVTFGRAFSEAASSIALSSVPSFVFIQFAGAGIALVIYALLQPKTER